MDDTRAARLSGSKDRRAEERKRVVDVDDVGPGLLDLALEEVLSLARPHDAERKLGLLPERPVLDLVAQQLELVDVAAVLAQQLDLVVDDLVSPLG
jgi:hypothetical protein